LTEKEMVSLKIYNTSGQEIATLENLVRDPGIYSKIWNVNGQDAGIYFCVLQAGETSLVKKLILIK